MLRGQCRLAMITNIEGSKGFKALQETLSGIGILALIRAILCGVEQHVHPTMAIMLAYTNLFCLWKKPGQKNDDYNRLFHSYETVLKSLGGQIPVPMELILEHFIKTGAISKGGTIKDMEEYQEYMDPHTFKTSSAAVRESFMTCMMLSGANKDCYIGLKAKLENAQLIGQDNSPKTRDDLMGILNDFKD